MDRHRRRSKWLVMLIVPFGLLGLELARVTDNRTESLLPADAESTGASSPGAAISRR